MVTDYRNVRLTSPIIAFDGLYYYTIDSTADTIVQKTDDGTVAFSYPMNRNITNPIVALCYEGINNSHRNGPPHLSVVSPTNDGNPAVDYTVLPPTGMAFWVLEDDQASGIVIRRFLIEDFIAKETNTFTIPVNSVGAGSGTGEVWDVTQMAVEMYETQIWPRNGMTQPGPTIKEIYVHDNISNTSSNDDDALELFRDQYGRVPDLPTLADENALLPLYAVDADETALLKRFQYDNGNEIIKAGQQVIIGPSTRTGYEGQFETVTVLRDIVSSDHAATQNSVANLGGLDSSQLYGSNNPIDDGKSRVLMIPLTGSLTKKFNRGDPVRWVKRIFVFNNNGNNNRVSGDGTGTGALYAFNPDGSFASYKGGDIGALFHNVEGATFSQRDRKIIFTKATNSLFMEPNLNDIKFVKTGLLDNYDTGAETPIPIYDLIATFMGELLRLQKKQILGGSMQSWSTYNYVVSPLFSLVTSISVRPNPQIIAADGADLSLITVTVKDQYNQPINNLTVEITDDNATGLMKEAGGGPTVPAEIEVTTDENGQALAEYQSGVDDVAVLITATVKQIVS